jgi:hypothetical protein
VCGAAYAMSRIYGRLYAEPLCAESLLMSPPLMCKVRAYIFDALMCWTAYVPSRLSTESAYVRASYALSRLCDKPFMGWSPHRVAQCIGRLACISLSAGTCPYVLRPYVLGPYALGPYVLGPYVLSPSLCGCLCTELQRRRSDPESGFTAECVAPSNQIGFVL